jgi:hypothetical protein
MIRLVIHAPTYLAIVYHVNMLEMKRWTCTYVLYATAHPYQWAPYAWIQSNADRKY